MAPHSAYWVYCDRSSSSSPESTTSSFPIVLSMSPMAISTILSLVLSDNESSSPLYSMGSHQTVRNDPFTQPVVTLIR